MYVCISIYSFLLVLCTLQTEYIYMKNCRQNMVYGCGTSLSVDCIYDCMSASLLLAKQQSGLAWQTSSTSRYIKYKTVGTIAFHAPCLLRYFVLCPKNMTWKTIICTHEDFRWNFIFFKPQMRFFSFCLFDSTHIYVHIQHFFFLYILFDNVGLVCIA